MSDPDRRLCARMIKSNNHKQEKQRKTGRKITGILLYFLLDKKISTFIDVKKLCQKNARKIVFLRNRRFFQEGWELILDPETY